MAWPKAVKKDSSETTIRVKTTYGEFINSMGALERWGAFPIDSKHAQEFAKVLSVVNVEKDRVLKELSTARAKLIERLGVEVMEEGVQIGDTPHGTGEFRLSRENEAAFQNAWALKLNEEFSFDVPVVYASWLAGVNMSPADMLALRWLIPQL